MEITTELKNIPNSVIGQILRDQEEDLMSKEEVISRMDDENSQQKDTIIQLQAEVCRVMCL